MNRKKKVLILITKSNWGGAQRYVYDLATSLSSQKFDVAVALGGSGKLVEMLESKNIKTIHIPSLQRDISFIKEFQSFIEIASIIRTEQPDILHVNSSKAGGMGAFIGRISGVPRVIYTAHGWAFNEDRSIFSKLIVGFFHWCTILLAHQTIAVSHAVKSQMKWPFTKNKITVIHNGKKPIELLQKNTARTEIISYIPHIAKYKSDLWTVTLAELHPIKRHDLIIKSVKEIIDSGTQIRHIIIGDGEMRAALEHLVAELKLQNNIFFAGHIHEAARLLTAFDIFILTSRSEALGYVLVEAGQAGLPIIATRVGGVPEIITDNETGILIPPNDTPALTRSLQTLTHDVELRKKYGTAAQIAMSRFSIEQMIEETETVYALV